MNTNADLIETFYTAFANGDAEGMIACYHPEIVFTDPAFGRLKGAKAKVMWKMLLSNKESQLEVRFGGIEADENTGKARWGATYLFGPKKRPVINLINARFRFKDGKIIEHTDSFSLWKWSRRALGISGWFLGWSGYMRKKVQETTGNRLAQYVKKNGLS